MKLTSSGELETLIDESVFMVRFVCTSPSNRTVFAFESDQLRKKKGSLAVTIKPFQISLLDVDASHYDVDDRDGRDVVDSEAQLIEIAAANRQRLYVAHGHLVVHCAANREVSHRQLRHRGKRQTTASARTKVGRTQMDGVCQEFVERDISIPFFCLLPTRLRATSVDRVEREAAEERRAADIKHFNNAVGVYHLDVFQ